MFKKIASDLELDKVLSEISAFALSRSGREKVLRSVPLADKDNYLRRQYLVSSMLNAKENAKYKDIYAEIFPDIGGIFENLKNNPTGALEGVELYDTGCFIRSAQVLRRVIEHTDLGAFDSSSNDGSRSVLSYSNSSIPDNCKQAEQHDNASGPILADILPPVAASLIDFSTEVFKILSENGDVKETYPTIQKLIKNAESKRAERASVASDFVSRNSSVMNGDAPVLRGGRLLLPVKREAHSQIQGFIQSTSQTGSTVFMETYALTRINNEVELAWREVQIEKFRLLSRLTNLLRAIDAELKTLVLNVTEADYLYAFASWIESRQCVKVALPEELSDGYKLNIIQARHPLLKEFCVPVDIKVPADIRAVVFTGPNAGGKTVTIKTAGLFVLINQICGYVPATEGTSMVLFDRVFTDIGDEQSIESGLSTFSAHMKETSYILKHLTSNSLLILDELGSGTDPAEGAALGRSILEYCIERAPLTLITSHYGVLKQYAYASDSVLNASMEFNEKTGEPTFRVINGLSGESHAIDAAIRMKMPRSVVAAAKVYLGKEAVKISNIIRGLEEKRKEAEEKTAELDRRIRALEADKKALSDKSHALSVYEANLREELYAEYNNFVKTERKNLENVVKELREGEINREKTARVKAEIVRLTGFTEEMRESLDKEEERLAEEDYNAMLQSPKNVEIKPGMDVLCGRFKREGTVIESVGRGQWQVAIGSMRFTFKESELTVPLRDPRGKGGTAYQLDGTLSNKTPKMTLDLRGYRLGEAIEAVDNQIESCVLHGLREFSVIHGYGDGILSVGIHNFLHTNKLVESFTFAHPEDGGQGKTYVRLK